MVSARGPPKGAQSAHVWLFGGSFVRKAPLPPAPSISTMHTWVKWIKNLAPLTGHPAWSGMAYILLPPGLSTGLIALTNFHVVSTMRVFDMEACSRIPRMLRYVCAAPCPLFGRIRGGYPRSKKSIMLRLPNFQDFKRNFQKYGFRRYGYRFPRCQGLAPALLIGRICRCR